MYLASFLTPEDTVLQGMVRLPSLPRIPEGTRIQWWKNYTQLLESLHAVGGTGASLRITLDPGVSLQRAVFACAPRTREIELRRFFAPFTRLETYVAGSATFPLSRAEYDVVADDVPLMRCRVTTPIFQAGNAQLACNFRVNPLLDLLLTQADTYGYRLSYHLNIRFIAIDRESLRGAKKNALEVRDLPGAPTALVTMQQRLADQLLHATAVCDEYLAVDSGPPLRWLREALQRNFRQQYEALHFEATSWDFAEGGYEEELASAAFITPNEFLVGELCATAIQDSQVTTLLSWRPADHLADRFAHLLQAERSSEHKPTLPANLPLAYTGNEPYIFVSYSRSDIDRVSSVMQDLQAHGYRLWYDRGILGGDEWTAVLEDRLMSCRALLLFLSQAAIDSKYVRREALFADSLDKRIISVRLEASELRFGMNLLLPRYQIIDQNTKDFFDQLARTLNNI